MWTHTVLELYSTNGWPEDGTPADWIEQGLVGWCQGDDETVVYFMPTWQIIKVKLEKARDNAWDKLCGAFYRLRQLISPAPEEGEWDYMFEELRRASDEDYWNLEASLDDEAPTP